jgi:DDE superfamily endonuclease
MEVWNEWLKWLDNNVSQKSLLIVDNCPAHTDGSSLGLKNLKIEFLPPNTTSQIQPCDAGIIRTFKSYYRNALVTKWIRELNDGQAINKLNLKEAIELIADAWDNVKQSTINNCWQNTGILPTETASINANEMEIDEIDEAMANLILALDNLRLADPLVNITADEYVNVDNGLVNTQLLTEDEIFEEFLIAEGVLQQVHVEENSSDEEEDAISVQMGREALELAKKFLEQREFTTESDIRYIRNIIRRLDDSVEKSKRQTLLTEFINQ